MDSLCCFGRVVRGAGFTQVRNGETGEAAGLRGFGPGRTRRVASVVCWLVAGIVLGAGVPCGAGATFQTGGDVDAGYEALRAGNYAGAVRIFRPLARKGSPAGLSGWVGALRETGDYEGAVRAAEGGVERGTAGARAHLGASLLELGRIDEARTALEAGAREPGLAGALARVKLGILEYRYGDRSTARTLFRGFIDSYNEAGSLSAAELTLVGRALVHLSRWNYAYAHDALRVLHEAEAAGPPDHTARLATAELFLERYDANQASRTFRGILAENPFHGRAHFGLARVSRLEGGGDSAMLLAAALDVNPNLVAARNLLARIRLMNGDRAGALQEVGRALEVNGSDLEALGTKAAIHHLEGEIEDFAAVMERIRGLAPAPTRPLVVLAELSADHRKYQEALDFAVAAATTDSTSWAGWGLAGLNLVRLGRVKEGREHLERAFAGDPFNLWFKNTLDLLDTFSEYRVVRTEHFELVLHESEADLLAPYVEPVAERAFREMSRRYGYTPPGPIRVEVYPRHADFSVRTIGLAGIGALGVSFGPALAMDSPAARSRGDFNWASTLWHEIAHSFHMGASDNEVPRWFSEGLAVHEQRKGNPSWGHQASIGFVRSLASGGLRPVSELDRGFSSPRHPEEVVHSYYQASLVFEVIEERFGFPAILDMLLAYRDGATDEEAFEGVLNVPLQDFDAEFEEYLKDRFKLALASVGKESPEEPPGNLVEARAAVARNPGSFVSRMALGRTLFEAGQAADAEENFDAADAHLRSAERHFEAALQLFPDYGGSEGPHWFLGQIRQREGDERAAARHYRALLRLNENHYDGRGALAELLIATGDTVGAAEVLRQAVYIHPYEIKDHERLAELLEWADDLEGAAAERRAVLALDPVDRARAHFRLAAVLHRNGDRSAARSAVLAALELAPNYEAALNLLLEIRRDGNDK